VAKSTVFPKLVACTINLRCESTVIVIPHARRGCFVLEPADPPHSEGHRQSERIG
jgi:hypothetical protein